VNFEAFSKAPISTESLIAFLYSVEISSYIHRLESLRGGRSLHLSEWGHHVRCWNDNL